MLETFSSKDAVELAYVERSGFIESRHIGAAVVVKQGKTLVELGDSTAFIYPRSTLKSLQTIAVLRAGVPLFGAEVAIASSSHTGSKWHLDIVERMLEQAGVIVNDLQCPPSWPVDSKSRSEYIKAGYKKSPLAMCCSGKHAAFLWACKENNWPIDSYLSPKHPLQKLIRETYEEFAEEMLTHFGIDGCGAPVPAMTLKGLATAIGKVAHAPSSHAMDARVATVATTILDYPEAIDGLGHPDTTVISELGILAKSGVEGVCVLAAEDGTCAAVKILDGNNRAATIAGITLLAGVGAVDVEKARQVLSEVVPPITGGTEVVGAIVPSAKLLATLG
ncbi:MAG: asparaginase [Micrococcaceae bacterium]